MPHTIYTSLILLPHTDYTLTDRLGLCCVFVSFGWAQAHQQLSSKCLAIYEASPKLQCCPIILELKYVVRIPIPVCPKPYPNPANYIHHTLANVKSSHSLHPSCIRHIPSSFLLSNPSFMLPPFISSLLFTFSHCHDVHAVRYASHTTRLFVQMPLILIRPTSSVATHICTYSILYHLVRQTIDPP